jgi:hypothetical protein
MKPENLRIPFEEAIQEPRLLKDRFESLSLPQRVALKSYYGLPLEERPLGAPYSELDLWTFFQGGGLLDELGYPLRRPELQIPYEPREYKEGWMIVGRRGSKTDKFGATIAAYEAALGGHEAFLSQAQVGLVFVISQDLRAARYALTFIRGALESSPLLGRLIKQVTSDRIDLKNNITIASIPATLKSVRGFSSPVAIFDEVGVWYQESESANPDFEIYRAVIPGQIQFPNRKIVGLSTPWNKSGLLYKFYEAGTNGSRLPPGDSRIAEFQNVIVLQGSTALMDNPYVTRDELAADRQRDLKAFEREYLAIFQDSISGFFSVALVERAVDRGITERPPQSGFTYIGAIDPAFKRDAFGFTICHRDLNGLVQDVTRRFVAPPGASLNPRSVLELIAPLCSAYGISVIFTDQWQLESLSELAREFNLTLMGIPFTAQNKARYYGNLQQAFAQNLIRILDDVETIRELKALERTMTGDSIKIAAPSGMYDDMAAVLCLAVNQAQLFRPRAADKQPLGSGEQTPYDLITAQLAEKRPLPGAWD